MGRLYRSKKRKAAHWMLSKLVEEHSMIVKNDNGDVVYRKEYSWITISNLADSSGKYEIGILRDAAHFLFKNQHIETLANTKDYNQVKVRANSNGEFAYRDSFYLMENRKDWNETIDSYAKWIVPLISLIVSVVALYFSIADD